MVNIISIITIAIIIIIIMTLHFHENKTNIARVCARKHVLKLCVLT